MAPAAAAPREQQANSSLGGSCRRGRVIVVNTACLPATFGVVVVVSPAGRVFSAGDWVFAAWHDGRVHCLRMLTQTGTCRRCRRSTCQLPRFIVGCSCDGGVLQLHVTCLKMPERFGVRVHYRLHALLLSGRHIWYNHNSWQACVDKLLTAFAAAPCCLHVPRC